MNRFVIGLLLALIIILPLPAASSVEASLGFRDTGNPVHSHPVSISASIDGFHGGLFLSGRDELGVSAGYTFALPHNLGITADLWTGYYPMLGGHTNLGVKLSHSVDIGWYRLSYGFGISGGLSWSEYINALTWSLSPYLHIANTFRFDPVAIILLLTFGHPWESEWCLQPLAALRVDIDIADGNAVFAEAYVKAAEYLFAYTEVVGSWGVRVGYTWRPAV